MSTSEKNILLGSALITAIFSGADLYNAAHLLVAFVVIDSLQFKIFGAHNKANVYLAVGWSVLPTARAKQWRCNSTLSALLHFSWKKSSFNLLQGLLTSAALFTPTMQHYIVVKIIRQIRLLNFANDWLIRKCSPALAVSGLNITLIGCLFSRHRGWLIKFTCIWLVVSANFQACP